MFKLSSISLLVANCIPVLGVSFLNWKLVDIMILYWSENLVIGFFNVLKMAKAQGRRSSKTLSVRLPQKGKIFTIIFFILHYGGFTLGHGVFVFNIFGKPDLDPFALVFLFLTLFTSHSISFFNNFLKGGEYQRITAGSLFMQPYNRVIIMHLAIIGGGFLIQALGTPVLALLVMMMLKTAIDLYSHRREHKKFQNIKK
jgi:hypothetical protein